MLLSRLSYCLIGGVLSKREFRVRSTGAVLLPKLNRVLNISDIYGAGQGEVILDASLCFVSGKPCLKSFMVYA